MSHFHRLFGQRLVVIAARRIGVERQIELVVPTKLETRFAEGIIAYLRARMAFGQIGRMGCQLIGDDAGFDVILIGQAQMLFRRHITKHGGAVPADLRRPNGRGDMVITRRDISGQRA